MNMNYGTNASNYSFALHTGHVNNKCDLTRTTGYPLTMITAATTYKQFRRKNDESKLLAHQKCIVFLI